MDVRNSIDGSLQISNEVVAKIAKLAALEIDGVADVSSGSMQSVRGLLSKASLQKPVTVDLSDGVAVVQVSFQIPSYWTATMFFQCSNTS